MKLKLLLGLLFVVWRSTSGEEYTNHYRATEDIANVEFCSHDSYKNGSCICNVDYNGNFCLNRKCRNFGYNGQNFPTGFKVDRCICPPGFLGRNCEPVACVPGKDQVYTSLPKEKSISLLVTYNTKMAETWKTGNIGHLICNKEDYWRSFNYNYENVNFNMRNGSADVCNTQVKLNLDADPCVDDDDNPIPCQKLNVANLNTLVQNSPPNSIIFVVTNMGLVSATDSLKESIIATSIARRIQINVLVYNNTGFWSTDPGLTYLSNIASATFGTYVLPSVKAVNEQHDIVKILLDNWDQGNLVSAVFTDKTQNLPMDNAVDYYIAAQTYFQEDLIFNVDATVVNKTDFWKLYKIPKGSVGHILTVSGQLPNTPVLLYSRGGLQAYSAFTSDESGNVDVVDAAYSISVNGTQYYIVVRLESGNSALDFVSGLRSFGTPSTITLGNSVYNRSNCQFNYMFDANCINVGASVVTLVTGDNLRSVSFPVYCASYSYARSIYNNLNNEIGDITHLQQRQSMSKDFTCTTDIGHEEYGGRSFVIIAENSKDADPKKSSSDNLFRNKNSIFYQLTDFVNGDGYSTNPRYLNYLATLHNGADSKNLTQSEGYETFLTKIMSATSNPLGHVETADAISVKDILLSTIAATNTYSDIFIVINYNLTVSDADVQAIQAQLEVQRSRLYVLFVQTYINYTNEVSIVYEQMNKLAYGSGGIAVRLKDYDDIHTFFVQYFPILVANDIVAKAYSENQKAGIALNDVYLLAEKYYLLVTNENSVGDGICQATIHVDGINITNQLNVGELQLFELTSTKADKYNIPIFFTGGLAQYANAILFVNTASQNFISLSFVDKDGKNRNDINYNDGAYTPVIYSSTSFDSSSNISITYSDVANPAKPIYSGSIINNTECLGFKSYTWTTAYSWPCSVSGGLYHVKIDRSSTNGTISRTFPIRCLGGDAGSCLNGGTPKDDKSCNCPMEWTGDHCESPVCLNGGEVTSAHTCNCTSPAFEGTFCETSVSNCGSTLSTPDYRADLSSLVIVADVSALAFGGLTNSNFGVNGVPITVILYGDGNAPRIVQSTTNSQHLTDVLTQVPQTTPSTTASAAPTNSDMYRAMNLALDNQLTNRALIVVYTSNSDVPVGSDFLIRLARTRAEVRVLSISGAESDNARTLSLIGNGIPLAINNIDDFQKYLSTYVAQLFQSLQFQANVPQRVFNVFKTDQLTGPTDVVIPRDSLFQTAQAIIFLHVYKGYLKTPTLDPIDTVGLTKIYSIPYKPQDGDKTLSLTWSDTDINGFYAVEVVGYLKTAYLFNKNNANGANEVFNSGVLYNETNSMHIFSSPQYDAAVSNPANFPFLSMKEILSNGTLSDPKTVLFSRKSDPSCFFKYFTTLDVCSNSATIGYQVQLTTRASATEIRQQQFVLTCFKSQYQSGDTTCQGHGSPEDICHCDPNWGGIDCREPVCANSGVRDISVCRCPVAYYGLRCEQTFGTAPATTSTPSPSTSVAPTSTPITSTAPPTTTKPTTTLAPTTTPKEVRVVAFILDIMGTDDYAYNQTIQSLTQYYKAFGSNHWVLLVSNLNQTTDAAEFQQYQGEDYLLNATVKFWPLRTQPSRTSSVTLALSTIKNAYNEKGTAFNGAVSMNIFYLTQIGISDADVPMNNMGGLELFTKSAVAYSPFTTSVDPAVTDSLKNKFSTDVSSAREYYSGLKAMVASTENNDNAVLPDPPQTFSCVYGLQSNIRVAIDRSNFSSIAVNESLNTFLLKFRLGFNFIENDEDRCATEQLPAFYKERTAMTAFPYYDNFVKTSKFCPSQYTSMLSFAVTGNLTVPNYNNPKLIPTLGKNINSATCSCNRFSDDKTMKIILWLPRAPIPSSADFLTSLKLSTTNAYHFVVPFYDITAESKATDLYYQILVDQVKGGDYYLLPNAAKATNIETDVINVLYEKLCESAGVDPTAVPPPPTFIESNFETRQDDYDFGIFD